MRHPLRKLTVPTLAAGVLLGGSAAAPNAFGDDPASKVTKAQDKIDQLSADLVKADKTLKETDKKVKAANDVLTKANDALTKAKDKQTTAQDAYDKAKKAEDDLRSALGKTVAAKKQATKDVGSLARYSFESGGMGPLTFTMQLLSAKHDVSGAVALSDVLITRQDGVVEQLDKTKKKQEEQAKTLATKTHDADVKKVQQDAAVTAADDAKAKAQDAKDAVDKLKKQQEKDKSNLEAKKKDAEQELKDAQAEVDRLKTVTTTSPNLDPGNYTSTGNGFLAAPMPASMIVSPFGYRIHPVLHYRKLHAGDDYPFACGTPVYAAGDGTVIESGYNDVSGNHVIISHGRVNGVQLASAYMHFQVTPYVSVGQRVKRGQQIGIAGMTGRVTGCHLHFEVHENGVAVNPLKWIG